MAGLVRRILDHALVPRQPKPVRFRPAMELGFDDCDPIATCHCGARCKGDNINDALTTWSKHLSTTHRGEW